MAILLRGGYPPTEFSLSNVNAINLFFKVQILISEIHLYFKTMKNKLLIIILFLSAFSGISANAQDDRLIKTRCYKTESPAGEVCLFEDRKAIAGNKEKYQDTCEKSASLSMRNLIQSELRVVSTGGVETDRVKVQNLSELDLVKFRVLDKKTFYVSVRNGACSIFEGVIYTPFWVVDGKIYFMNIENKNKYFMKTLRKTWAPVHDGFLEVISEPAKSDGTQWETNFIRYQNLSGKWLSIKNLFLNSRKLKMMNY